MPIKIRLARFGKKNSPFYRIVVIPGRTKREGKFIDTIGHYNPLSQSKKIFYSEEKLQSWLKKGAKISEGLQKLIRRIK